MKEGPDIARIASLIGDPARANILAALMTGKALTATELANEAGVTPQTASSHLKKLEEGGLTRLRREGRHKYVSLAGEDVAVALEALMGLAAGRGHLRTRTGPKDEALRHARVCYSHLAGEKGVQMFRSMKTRGFFEISEAGLDLSPHGAAFVADLGIDLAALPRSTAPMCRECLDWSARESHLAGRLGRALYRFIEDEGWAARIPGARVVEFSRKGDASFARVFALT